MRKFFGIFCVLGIVIISGCDLQPKIASIPDSVGDFISERYPTLLAEPDSEIYKTAVADYGVYASPAVYGDGDITDEDYVLYSSVDDYTMPSQERNVVQEDVSDTNETDEEDDDEEEESSGYEPDTDIDDLKIPDYVKEKQVESKVVEEKKQSTQEVEKKSDAEQDFVRAPLREITVEKGDTLYSLSRKYSVPVNDLAVMNKISAPFALSVGQKLKVPDVLSVPEKKVEKKPVITENKKIVSEEKPKVETKTEKKPEAKIDSEKKPVQKTEKKEDKKTVGTKTVSKSDTTDKKSVAKVEKTPVAAAKTPVEKPNKTIEKKTERVVDKKTDVKKAEVKKTEQKKSKSEVKKDEKADTKKLDNKNQKTKKADAEKSKKQQVSGKTQTSKRSVPKMVARSSSRFSWPVRGKILSGYGSKSNGLFNDGINIKAAQGTSVLASENGFVAYAGNEVKGMGNLIIIQHADGWMTVYAHMNSMAVKRGHGVTVGQKIGTVGTSGKVDQPQLHFEIRKGTKAYNPVNYLKK